MDLIQLKVNRISYSQSQNGAYALILEEVDGDRKLPIVIGGFEAQSIAIALEKNIDPPRPLTHDLFKNFAQNFDIKIKQVIINKLIDGIFYSSLICEQNKVEEIILALSATIEGQTTALVIRDYLEKMNLKITQLAYGVPVGSEIHYLDDNTLGAALESRKNLS